MEGPLVLPEFLRPPTRRRSPTQFDRTGLSYKDDLETPLGSMDISGMNVIGLGHLSSIVCLLEHARNFVDCLFCNRPGGLSRHDSYFGLA